MTPTPVHHVHLAAARWCSRAGAAVVVSAGAAALVGWMFQLSALKSVMPGLATMKVNTAIGLVAAGSALLLIGAGDGAVVRVRIARVLAAGTMLVAGLTLAEYLLAANLGIDQLLFLDGGGAGSPGRMAPATAVALFFVGSALLPLTWHSPRVLRWAGWLAVPSLFISTLALLGYAYDTPSLYQVTAYASMAIPTALALCVLSLSVLAANPQYGFVATVVSDSSGGVVARQLMPVISLILFAVGWIGLAGQKAGYYDASFALGLVVILSASVSLFAIAGTALRLRRLDVGRQKASSDIVELNAGLRQTNFELEQASRVKSEFLSNMSHELRTPLNAIVGFSEVLKDGLIGPLSEQQRGFATDIFNGGQHLLMVINDILDLSKAETGKMTLDLEPVRVAPLLVKSVSALLEGARARQIHVALDAPEGIGLLQADPRKVEQIVQHLLSNAIKFSHDGGDVTLRASRVPRGVVGRQSGVQPGRSVPLADSTFTEFLEISVTDTGIGISSDGLPRLFEPFSQVDTGLARRFEGAGLGLALVKRFTELHGGAVAVESEPNVGSRFVVWLPCRELAEESIAAPRTVNARRVRADTPTGARIALMVEDDAQAADLIRTRLEAEGFGVLHATSAEAALVIAIQQPLSLITLDIMLPNMDGWELLTRLKQVPDLRRIPVVIISLAADPSRGFSLGAAAVMEKPISRQELYEALTDLGLCPLAQGQALKVLVVDDDPKAVELLAVQTQSFASRVLRAYGGRAAITVARRELPDVIVLDLMMPEVSGFDVVEALNEHVDTARIPILVVTAKQITADDRAKLGHHVKTIMDKAAFDPVRLTAEVRRAMSGRRLVA